MSQCARVNCVVPHCSNSKIRTPTKFFFSSPMCDTEEKKSLRRKWLKAMRRNFSDFSENTKFHVCEDHFHVSTIASQRWCSFSILVIHSDANMTYLCYSLRRIWEIIFNLNTAVLRKTVWRRMPFHRSLIASQVGWGKKIENASHPSIGHGDLWLKLWLRPAETLLV